MSARARPKVLVTDGDQKISELIWAALSTQDFDIFEAGTAWDCIGLVWKESFDVIILDLDRPDHDGWEVLDLMRVSGIQADSSVIIMTPDVPSPTAVPRSRAVAFVRWLSSARGGDFVQTALVRP